MRSRRTCAALFALFAIAAFGTVVTPALAASPTTVVVAVPGPGNQTGWSRTLTNDTGEIATVIVSVSSISGAQGDFGDLLRLSLGRGASSDLVPLTPLADWENQGPISVDSLGVGDAFEIGGLVELAQEAGNALEGASGSIAFRLSLALNDPPPNPPFPPLPPTGLDLPAAAVLGVVAIAVLVGGWLGARGRRGRSA